MNRWTRRIFEWILFRDLIGEKNEPITGDVPDMHVNERYACLISQEVSKKKIVPINDPDAITRKEAVFETENGIASIKCEALLLCSCGKLVFEPFAICTVCGMPICTPDHFVQCFVCRAGLCPRCVRWFRVDGANGQDNHVPLCEKHYSVSTLAGEIRREWM